MKVSVITPSFNQAAFLEATIRSVLDQGYPDLEYMVIDGGSTDGSVEIIKKYSKYLAFWVSEKDGGQSQAINKGFKRATGGLVGWINSDDYYAPGSFSKVIEAFQGNDRAGIVYGDNNLVDEHSAILGQYRVRDITVKKLLYANPNVVQPGSFYRREFLERAGLLDESLRFIMDYELWLRLGRISEIIYVPQILANFRWHANSKTISQRAAFAYETFEVRKRYGIRKISWANRILFYRLLRDKLGLWR